MGGELRKETMVSFTGVPGEKEGAPVYFRQTGGSAFNGDTKLATRTCNWQLMN